MFVIVIWTERFCACDPGVAEQSAQANKSAVAAINFLFIKLSLGGRAPVTVSEASLLTRLLFMQFLFVQIIAALFQNALSDKGDGARGAVVYAAVAKSAGTGRKDGLALLNRD